MHVTMLWEMLCGAIPAHVILHAPHMSMPSAGPAGKPTSSLHSRLRLQRPPQAAASNPPSLHSACTNTHASQAAAPGAKEHLVDTSKTVQDLAAHVELERGVSCSALLASGPRSTGSRALATTSMLSDGQDAEQSAAAQQVSTSATITTSRNVMMEPEVPDK